jgi:integrase
VRAIRAAADQLANSKNLQIQRAWERYRPMLYLAADSGMRSQEYIVVPDFNFIDGGVKVDRALEKGGEIVNTKTPASSRLVEHYCKRKTIKNDYSLVFPTSSGHWRWRNVRLPIPAGLTSRYDRGGRTSNADHRSMRTSLFCIEPASFC